MSRSKTEHLVEVKLSLAKKYDRLALHAGSKPKRKTLKNRAARYRRQADRLQRND